VLDKQATTGDTSTTCGIFGLPPPLRETGGQISYALTDAAVLPPVLVAGILLAIKLYSDRLLRPAASQGERIRQAGLIAGVPAP